MTRKNFHVPLSEELYSLLQDEARRCSCPATQLAREVLERHLRHAQKAWLEAQIADYARRAAGSLDDLDPQLEQAGLECLSDSLRDEPW